MAGTVAAVEALPLSGAVPVPAQEARTGPGRTRRIPKPVIAAAATSGVVLMGLPLLLSQLGGGSGPAPGPARPPGYNQPDGGPDGFVPGADAPDGANPPSGGAVPGAAGVPGSGDGTTAAGPAAGQGPPTDTTANGTGQTPAQAGAGTGQPPTGGGSDAQPAGGNGSPVTSPAVPGDRSGQPPVAPPSPAQPGTKEYAAVAGPGCAGPGATFDWIPVRKDGWKGYDVGGYGSSGCNGDFYAMPMSGDSGRDAGNQVRWTFRTGAVTTGTCQVFVHIPNNGDVRAVGGKASYYSVHAGSTGGDPFLGSFTVNQPSQLGRWVAAGSFRITGGRLAVKLHDRGTGGSGSTYARHAAEALRVQCTGS
ncbi:hypothetical protein [Streptomyces sp. WAC06614]|uniref:hypothetical protein n=1 Tax=Streptomyces sp. WAC06614 TaxID=2487416 RepID=UPI00163CEA63|nr:hypothetical protein [Streptomyces sp. WAC06614]